MLIEPPKPYDWTEVGNFFRAYLSAADQDSHLNRFLTSSTRKTQIRRELAARALANIRAANPAQLEDLIKFAMNNR